MLVPKTAWCRGSAQMDVTLNSESYLNMKCAELGNIGAVLFTLL